MTIPSITTPIDLASLVSLFYDEQGSDRSLGCFQKCSVESMPSYAQRLLAHEHHMTVTVEQHFHEKVDLKVLQSQMSGESYWRKIILTLGRRGQVAMFGLVRIDLTLLDDSVREAIGRQEVPLGRILIEHNVLRKVQLVDLYRIEPGEDLLACWPRASRGGAAFTENSEISSISANEILTSGPAAADVDKQNAPCCYGRTALIYCDQRPVIELLEIVDGQIESEPQSSINP